MRRDRKIVRDLMLALETTKRPITGALDLDGWSADEVAYHLALIVKGGYSEGPEPRYSSRGGDADTTVPIAVIAFRLTPAGHELIHAIQSDNVWKKVVDGIANVGGNVSMEMLRQLGVTYTKQFLGLPP